MDLAFTANRYVGGSTQQLPLAYEQHEAAGQALLFAGQSQTFMTGVTFTLCSRSQGSICKGPWLQTADLPQLSLRSGASMRRGSPMGSGRQRWIPASTYFRSQHACRIVNAGAWSRALRLGAFAGATPYSRQLTRGGRPAAA